MVGGGAEEGCRKTARITSRSTAVRCPILGGVSSASPGSVVSMLQTCKGLQNDYFLKFFYKEFYITTLVTMTFGYNIKAG